MKDKSEKWKDKGGNILTTGDCRDALRCGISLINKEISFNPKIEQRDKRRYEKHIDVLEKIHEQYELAEEREREVRRTTVKKRPEKKKRIIMPGDNSGH